MNVYRTACPLNCTDHCSLIVKTAEGQPIAVRPNPDQKITGHFLCPKGRDHVCRLRHPARLTRPLIRASGGGLQEIAWPEALDLFAARIREALERFGPLSILHFYDSGHGGILKNIESRFFSALGGCTVHRGGLCWSAGLDAQRYDFGESLAHDYADLPHSRLVLLWGRNPAATAPHLVPFIRRARDKGARIILIDPLRTATAALADEHIAVRPASDGALALAMAHVIVAEGAEDRAFLEAHSSGFPAFRELLREHPPERAARITGIPAADIARLAREYAGRRPAAILIGYGLQRHTNGGAAVRAIDALAALTGQIGIPGGGASYANRQVTRYMDHAFLEGKDLLPRRRFYPKPRLAAALEELRDPPVALFYCSRANPLSQVGHGGALRHALAKVPFKVVSDHFLTDTAAAADLVLPATFFLEEEDLYFTSMSHTYLNYGPRICDPPELCRSEYAVFQELAGMLEMEGFPGLPPERLLERIIRPLTARYGLTLADLKKGPTPLPGASKVPWQDRRFHTPDGKFNFYSRTALEEGCDPLPFYREPVELGDRSLKEQGYCYWFVTPHPARSIHSIHRLPGGDWGKTPRAYLHPDTARRERVRDGERITVSSVRGSITLAAAVSNRVPPGAVLVYEGWWRESGASVNDLTPDRLADLGSQAALYDCLCRIN